MLVYVRIIGWSPEKRQPMSTSRFTAIIIITRTHAHRSPRACFYVHVQVYNIYRVRYIKILFIVQWLYAPQRVRRRHFRYLISSLAAYTCTEYVKRHMLCACTRIYRRKHNNNIIHITTLYHVNILRARTRTNIFRRGKRVGGATRERNNYAFYSIT